MTGDLPEREHDWPIDKLSALRFGRRLVAEIPATATGLRAFVDITALPTPADTDAAQAGWIRTDQHRAYRVQHREYRADLIDGFDYDIGSTLIKEATVTGELELATTLATWHLQADQFLYPWQTDDPK